MNTSPKEHQQAIDQALESLDFELDKDTYKRLLSFTYKAGIDPDEPFWWVFVMLGYFSRLVATAPKDVAQANKEITKAVARLEKLQAANIAIAKTVGNSWIAAIIAGAACLGTGVFLGYFIAVPSKAEIQSIEAEAQKAIAVEWFDSIGSMGDWSRIRRRCIQEFDSGSDCVIDKPN